jgi:hypothetical protein
MKFAKILRTPYRCRTIVPSSAIGRLSDAVLGRAIVLARLVLVTLCAARAATDWLHGRATPEGDVALMLVVAFTMWLTAEAIGGSMHAEAPVLEDTPYRSSRARGVGGQDGRSR